MRLDPKIVAENISRCVSEMAAWNNKPVKPVEQETTEYYNGKVSSVVHFYLYPYELENALNKAHSVSDCEITYDEEKKEITVIRERIGAPRRYVTIYRKNPYMALELKNIGNREEE